MTITAEEVSTIPGTVAILGLSIFMVFSQRVVVSYSAPQSLLASSQWPQIYSALLSHLPLRSIHWKSASRSSIRTIQELDVQLVHLDALHEEHTSQIPVTLLEKPLLNIYIVTCEVSYNSLVNEPANNI
jgi:hypothetical protein